jgi:hypothetical protein
MAEKKWPRAGEDPDAEPDRTPNHQSRRWLGSQKHSGAHRDATVVPETKKGPRSEHAALKHTTWIDLLFDSIRSDRIRPNPELNQVVNRTCIPAIREKSGIHLRGIVRTP